MIEERAFCFGLMIGAVVSPVMFLAAYEAVSRIQGLYLKRIRLVTAGHTVITSAGENQLDGRVYPDSGRIDVTAVLALPEDVPSKRCRVQLWLRDPTGNLVTILEAFCFPRWDSKRLTVPFSLDADPLLRSSGMWTASIEVLNGSSLATVYLEVPNSRSAIDDIQVVRGSFWSCVEGRYEESKQVFPQSGDLVFIANLRPSNWALEKYEDTVLEAQLAKSDGTEVLPPVSVPLAHEDGILKAWVNCAAFLERPGDWRVTLRGEGRDLVSRDCHVLTCQEIRQGILVDKSMLVGRHNNGKYIPLTNVLFADHFHAATVALSLKTKHPSKLAYYDIRLTVRKGRKLVDEQTQCIRFCKKEKVVRFEEFRIPSLAKGAEEETLAISVTLGEQTLIRESVVLRCSSPLGGMGVPLLPEGPKSGPRAGGGSEESGAALLDVIPSLVEEPSTGAAPTAKKRTRAKRKRRTG